MQRLYPFLFVFPVEHRLHRRQVRAALRRPLSFLLARYGLVIALMTVIALATRAPWPQEPAQWLHIAVSGILVHAVYLGGVFVAIKHGLPAGVTALVVGMQPLLTAIGAGWLLGEAVSGRQWAGLALGFVGVGLVVSGKFGDGAALGPMLIPALVALLGITAGTLYQKRFCARFDLRTGSVIQFVPTAIVTAIAIAWFEEFHIEWTADFIFALGWLVLVLSLGAISLLNLLIRSGSAVNVASLFYLTPHLDGGDRLGGFWRKTDVDRNRRHVAGRQRRLSGGARQMSAAAHRRHRPGVAGDRLWRHRAAWQPAGLRASGCIKSNDRQSLPERIRTLFAGISEVVATYGPDQAAVEKVFVNVNPQSTLLLGQARGAALSALVHAGLPVAEYTALQVKQAVVGQGKAAKETGPAHGDPAARTARRAGRRRRRRAGLRHLPCPRRAGTGRPGDGRLSYSRRTADRMTGCVKIQCFAVREGAHR
jgi:drug/metabolite transporter (DMT)-like permease